MNVETISSVMDGARIALCLVISLCFARLGLRGRDRLYYAFAIAFLLLAVNWSLLALGAASGDHSGVAFVPRLIAFLVIIVAIVDKNRRAKRG